MSDECAFFFSPKQPLIVFFFFFPIKTFLNGLLMNALRAFVSIPLNYYLDLEINLIECCLFLCLNN